MNLSFHGAVRGVTGSAHLVKTKNETILVDCGFFQGERFCGGKNFEPFGFDPASVDAVFVTHAHYDHTGRLPLLVKQGFSGPIYMTSPTKALSELVLRDAMNIMAEEAIECGLEPLYEPEHLEQTIALMKGVNYHTELSPVGRVGAMFHNAGHILGSAYVTLDIPAEETEEGKPLRLLFSGDVGNDDVPILPETEPIERADVIVCESTYGNREHEPTAERNDKLKAFIAKVIGRGGTLIIPAFSIERTQELLYELDLLVDKNEIPRTNVYLDSPLAIRSTEVYRHFKHYLSFDRPVLDSPDRDFFSFKGLKETLSVDASKAINEDKGPKIIIAGSGMMTGGRVLHHLKRYLPDEKSGVLIIGYQAEGTLGRSIQNGVKHVRIYRDEIPVFAEVETIHAFSAHADRAKLARWLKPKEGPQSKTFLVHGDTEIRPEFKTYLESQGVKGDIILPDFQSSFDC